jgi:hypothetical protein
MTFTNQFLTFRRLSIAATCAALTACGGGGGSAPATNTPAGVAAPADTTAQAAATVTANTAATATVAATTAVTATAVAAVAITDVRFQNTDSANVQNNTPFTFGQVFNVGQISPTDVISGRLDDGTVVPLQVDVKATHPDGSVRHAIISGILPSVAASTTRTMSLLKGGAAPATATGTVSNLMKAGFSASFHAKINGVDYFVSADDLLKTTAPTSWLKGGVANEWQVSAPLHTADGTQHPHLTARFAVRWFESLKKARVDLTVENDWAYEPSPQKFTYDASILIGGKTAYSLPNFTHLHHTRWRKMYWFNGTEPTVTVKHNVAYLIGTRALPNFDQSLSIPNDAIAGFLNRWQSANIDPMGNGLTTGYMPTTGGRDDIGLLPNWAASYLLSQDSTLKEITLRNADLAGSFSSHYRDKKTGRPVSLMDYPYMTINGRWTDTMNPATGKYENFPDCAPGMCDSPYTHDASHQPALAYLPYLVSGDYYYLEELQFWAMWNAFETNPGYRNNIQGVVASEQVRGQAWSLRTLAEAAYITPDKDVMKTAFTNIINSNLDWYNNTYLNDPTANKLGVIVNGYALGYDNGTGLAPWQDDFFTSAIGHVAELGFTKANNLLMWKAQFPINRMVGDGACWVDGAIYQIHVRATDSSPYYTSIGQAYANSHTADFNALQCGSQAMAGSLGLQVGEMTGYSYSNVGYPSNMQPALAVAADIGGATGKKAWAQFMARSVKPDYRYGPQFAIVPR